MGFLLVSGVVTDVYSTDVIHNHSPGGVTGTLWLFGLFSA